MAASKALDPDLKEEIIFRCLFAIKIESHFCSCTTRATDKYLSFVLAIQIEKILTAHKTRFHTLRTGKASFFIARKDTFYRSVFNCIISQQGQFHCHADTVICS